MRQQLLTGFRQSRVKGQNEDCIVKAEFSYKSEQNKELWMRYTYNPSEDFFLILRDVGRQGKLGHYVASLVML